MKKFFVAMCLMLFTAVAMIAGNVNTGNDNDVGIRYQDESSGTVMYAMNVEISLPVKNVEVATHAEFTDVGTINQFEYHSAVMISGANSIESLNYKSVEDHPALQITDTGQKLRKKRTAANMTRAVTYCDTGEQNQMLLS